jgi:5-methylcytosine-specific restriction endonuclease McrA
MNTDVITRLHELCRREHACTVDVIEALLECERTGAHLAHGHDGLWSLLVHELGYSNAAASRRLRATRCARKFPAVIGWLRQRRVSLSSLEAVEPLVDSMRTEQELLDRIEGKVVAEVVRAVQRERPTPAKKEKVRRTFVKPQPQPTGELFVAPVPAPASPAPIVEKVEAALSFTPEEFAVVEQARALVSRKTGRMPSVHETMMELARFYVAAKGLRPPRERRAARERVNSRSVRASSAGSDAQPSSTQSSGANAAPTSDRKCAPRPARRSRHIPRAIRDAVMRRDDSCCAYTGPDGRRCGSTKNVQIDHVHPFALGGGHEMENLRVLCGVHNRFLGERRFGGRWRRE